MTIDLSKIDLLALIGRDTPLRRTASTNGGEYSGPCPFCGGKDRFSVQPNTRGKGRWFCRGCGGNRWHDAIDYIDKREPGLSWREKLERMGLDSDNGVHPSPPPRPPLEVSPPGPMWQAQGRAFCEESKAALWAPGGSRALDWLRGRGLSDETIQAARLGYNPADRWDTWEVWGLEPRKGRRGVWLPRGVVIPWLIGGDLWRVNIRRPVGDPKYIGPAGFGNSLYNADTLVTGKPTILVEGELDALTIDQVAGDLVMAAATGATGGARRTRWIARLALCPLVLVAFDADEPGQEAARYWLEVLANAKRWQPYWEDANAMAQGGADVRAWVAAGVATDVEQWSAVTSATVVTLPVPREENRPHPSSAGLITSPAQLAIFPNYAPLLARLDLARHGREEAGSLVAEFEATMEDALAVLEAATGCPDSEAERLLQEWDRLIALYGDMLNLVQVGAGQVVTVTNSPAGDPVTRGKALALDVERAAGDRLPQRVGDGLYRATLL